MTTHVFIVASTTFKTHLEYLFAGTGAVDDKVDFNNSPTTCLHQGTEKKLVDMIADGSRIRKGDQIFFYLQQYKKSEETFGGKFFGIFKAKHDWSFLDDNDDQQYLKDELVHLGTRNWSYQFNLRLSLRHDFSRNPEGFKPSLCMSDGNLYAPRLTPRCTRQITNFQNPY